MFLVPYERFELTVQLTPEEVRHRLAAATSKVPWFRKPRPGTRFYGKVGSNQFRLFRVITGRNSYLPLLHCKIIPQGERQSLVRVVAALHPLVALFMTGFLGVVITTSLRSGGWNILATVPFLGLHALLWAIGFVPEVQIAQRELLEALHTVPF